VANIWNTGAIGLAVAWQRFEIALVLSLVNFLTLRIMSGVKEDMDHEKENEEESESGE